MSAQILDALDGIVTAEITGKISASELAACQAEILNHLQQWNGGSILTLCENFEGFAGGDWSDLSFQNTADPLIRKMAIVGEQQWKDMAIAFTAKGLRPFPVEFFPTGHMRDAMAWLKS
jgi:hypothetical protein